MPESPPPIGQRFSQLYLRPEAPHKDSDRARKRLGSLLRSDLAYNEGLAQIVIQELGVDVPMGYARPRWDEFVEECALRDLLDLITLVWRNLHLQRKNVAAERWLTGCRRIFAEESIGYRIDDAASVHYQVDPVFEALRITAIGTLGKPRYGAVYDEFEKAHASLDALPPDFKGAVRHAFESVETLFKLICPKAARIGKAKIKQHLEPLVVGSLSADTTASRAAAKLLASFGEWVDGVHFYRHGQSTEEPIQPPPGMAVMIVSQATAYLRWLAELDAGFNPATGKG